MSADKRISGRAHIHKHNKSQIAMLADKRISTCPHTHTHLEIYFLTMSTWHHFIGWKKYLM